MSTTNVNVPINRNFLIPLVLVLVALVLAALYYYFVYQKPPIPSPEEVVDVIVGDKPLNIPEEFKDTLARLEIEGIGFVDREGKLSAYEPDGTPKNLCGQESETDENDQRSCRLAIPSGELITMNIGGPVGLAAGPRCPDAYGNLWSCHITGPNKNKYPGPGKHSHYWCHKACK